ncbi:hypothetical protein [Vibrio alginolyticus]|uniref:hypothetical protein n=1 Tax=Vibrio alginolyticus TaxID=663 RepID=UPI00211AA2FD|nr:hypothetical protein [Vibrio alginolyticus]MCQ9091213.1 hypothetical protein [Vibrio alginolyticus]
MQNVIRDIMTKIQCTFRLPKEVVELIDSKDGKDRTNKLLSLLGMLDSEPKKSVMQNVISDALHERLESIESRLSSLETSKNDIIQPQSLSVANKKRKEQTIHFIEKELNKLTSEQIENAIQARYPLSEVRKCTEITKSQCDSYGDRIKTFLGIAIEKGEGS